MSSTRKPKLKSVGNEGIFYLVPFPLKWRLMRVCLYMCPEVGHVVSEMRLEASRVIVGGINTNPDLGHPEFWEDCTVDLLILDWHSKVREEFPTMERLRDALLPLAYACPRGRVTKVGNRFKVYHGNDLETFMKITRRDIEEGFDIAGKATWAFDDHERCQQPDKDSFRRMLGIKKDWNAV